jgi:hypothetical protein
MIVTGCDDTYFGLVRDLIASIRRFPRLADMAIGVIDGGLTAAQRTQFEEMGVMVVDPVVPDYVPAAPLAKRRNLAVNISKLWLNTLFPSFDTVLWIDADAWVQEEAAVETLFGATTGGRLAIVPQGGRFWADQIQMRWLLPGIPQIRSFLYKNVSNARLPGRIKRNIASKAALNAGVWALRLDAPHWPALQAWQKTILRHGKLFTADQLALSLVYYEDNLPVNLMPQSYNYMGPWRVNEETGALVEYYYPYPPAGIVHLAGEKNARFDRTYQSEVSDRNDVKRLTSLRFQEERSSFL